MWLKLWKYYYICYFQPARAFGNSWYFLPIGFVGTFDFFGTFFSLFVSIVTIGSISIVNTDSNRHINCTMHFV